MENGIQIIDVNFFYDRQNPVLKDVNCSIPQGVFLGITGINGSGKTTFSYLLNGLIPHVIEGHMTGEVTVDGISTKTEKVSYFAGKVGMVFQNPDFSIFNLTVSEEIMFALKNLSLPDKDIRIHQALETVGMKDFTNNDPQKLSLGQKQKISLASVLAIDPPYIVLDEPTAQLDYQSAVHLYETLSSLNKKGKTIITIEHDTDFLWKYTSNLLVIDQGRIIAEGSTKDILKKTKLLNQLGIKIPKYVT